MNSSLDSTYIQLNDWYGTPLGRALAKVEQQSFEAILPHLFGYHILQLGVPFQTDWLAASPIAHQICLSPGGNDRKISVLADFSALPFKADSIDVIILPHTLAVVDDPEQVLAEVTRVLMPEGHCLLLGFNPLSLWGIGRSFLKHSNKFPWNGRFLSVFQVRRILNRLECDVIDNKSYFYRPPSNSAKSLERWLFLESLGQLFWPYPGGAYLLHAQKRISRLTPIPTRWHMPKLLASEKPVAKPSTRHQVIIE